MDGWLDKEGEWRTQACFFLPRQVCENAFRLLESRKRDEIKTNVSFDRHPQIHKLMRVDPSFNDVKHQFDLWHVAKGICESLNKASVKKKTGQAVAIDTICIVNHFWWSVSTCNKDPQLLYEGNYLNFCNIYCTQSQNM